MKSIQRRLSLGLFGVLLVVGLLLAQTSLWLFELGLRRYLEVGLRNEAEGLLVSINRDGSLYEVQVLESSGQPLLDQAAQRIVLLAAPFAPFSGDLNDVDRLEIIRTWRFAKGDRLSGN